MAALPSQYANAKIRRIHEGRFKKER